MSICSPNCTIRPPQPPIQGCTPDRRAGGINRLVFATCDFIVAEGQILNSKNWCSAVYSGKVVVSSPIVGQKPKGTQTTKRFTSCAPETVTGYERTITFMDYTADNENYSDYDFWNEIQADPSKFQVGYLTCDGYFTGFIPNFTIEVSPVIEDVNTGSSMWEGTIKWTGLEMPEPVFIPNFLEILTGNCDEVPGFNPCAALSSIVQAVPNTSLCANQGQVTLRAPRWLNIDNYKWAGTVLGPLPQFDGMAEIVVDTADTYTVTMTRDECTPTTSTASTTVVRTTGTPCFDSPTAYTAVLGPNGEYSVTIHADLAGVGCQPDYTLIQFNLVTESGYENGWQPGNNLGNSTIGQVVPGTHTILIRNINTGCVERRIITLP